MRDVDEPHRPTEHQQRQLVVAAGLGERLGRGMRRLQADAGRSRPGHRRYQPIELGGGHAGQRDAGREQELAAPQHPGHSRRLEHVHPFHPVCQVVAAGGHADLGRSQHLERQ